MSDAAARNEQAPAYTVNVPPVRYRFTKENARMYGLKGVQAREANRAIRKAQANGPTLQAVQQSKKASDFVSAQARRIEKEIAKLVTELGQITDAKAQQAKATALDKLYQTYADMTGLERRGVSRPRKHRPVAIISAFPDQPEDQ